MFSSSNNNNSNTGITTAAPNFGVYISKNAELSGNISVKGSARIDGTFSGIIYSEEDIIVGETGNLKANVYANNVTVAGIIEGNVVAKQKLEVLANSSIKGDIRSAQMLVELGGTIRGNVGGIEDTETLKLDKTEPKFETLTKSEDDDE